MNSLENSLDCTFMNSLDCNTCILSLSSSLHELNHAVIKYLEYFRGHCGFPGQVIRPISSPKHMKCFNVTYIVATSGWISTIHLLPSLFSPIFLFCHYLMGKLKRQKNNKRNMNIYTHTFGFRQPYQVIADGNFIHVARLTDKKLDEALPVMLGGEVRLSTFY